jgi:S1-C subfamily serine protease
MIKLLSLLFISLSFVGSANADLKNNLISKTSSNSFKGIVLFAKKTVPIITSFHITNSGRIEGSYKIYYPNATAGVSFDGKLYQCFGYSSEILNCTWEDETGKGTFQVLFSSDFNSFSGTRHFGEWNNDFPWNGKRVIKTENETKIPPNAYASGSSWKCNPGFERQGNTCNQIEDDRIIQARSGSGFATTKEGHILTNHHVIDGCNEVTLFKNGKSYLTTIVTQDPNNDLAILQSDFKPTKVYSLSSEVYLSDDIFAAGFPFGKKISSAITINKGIISALMGPGDDISIFQIDADINSGNSGGPIVDKRGNAIGIAVAKLNAKRAREVFKLGSTPEGFNFAVNSMMAISLFRSQGIDIPPQNNNELSVKDRNDLFNHGTFYLACGMTIAQYEKMIKTDKVMFTRDVFFSNFEGN